MRKTLFFLPLITVYLMTAIVLGQDIKKEIKVTSEKSVDLRLESAFGTVNVSKGKSGNVVGVYFRNSKKEAPNLDVHYKMREDEGDLDIEMNPRGVEIDSKGKTIQIDDIDLDFDRDIWFVQLSDKLDYKINAELGAGKSHFDLSGIRVKELSLSAGASSSTIEFDQMNSVPLSHFSIETGVSKFTGKNLCNANFEKMKFSGGVGSYLLNFGGELKKEADVDVEVGLGSITIEVPKNIGAVIRYNEGWLSNISIGSGFERQRKGVYKTDNYSSSEGRLNIWVEASMGTVKIRQAR